jgi:hypothetical protein
MEFVLKDLLTKRVAPWVCLVAAAVIFLCTLTAEMSQSLQGWLVVLAYVLCSTYLGTVVYRAACQNHKHLLTVCIWSFVIVLLGVATTYFAFFAIVGDEYDKYSKVLNIVPVLVAIWAASVGWLIHFRLTTKASRTNNAFSIVMETRKSSEFLARQGLVFRHFPPGCNVDDSYAKYFPRETLKGMYLQADWDEKQIAPVDLEKAKAIDALKYLLNYYEFVAAGIRAGDLDEVMCLESFGGTVTGLCKRANLYIQYIQAEKPTGAGEPLAYEALLAMCPKWERRLDEMKLEIGK